MRRTNLKIYDMRTHRNADAIIFIGCLGGLVIGIILAIFDFATLPPSPPRVSSITEAGVLTMPKARNHAFIRLLLWPGLAAISGVVGTLLWHLRMNEKPQPHAEQRAITGCVIQVMGACAAVVAPTIVQILSLASERIVPLRYY